MESNRNRRPLLTVEAGYGFYDVVFCLNGASGCQPLLFKIKGFWKVLPRNPRLFEEQMEWLFLDPVFNFEELVFESLS